MIDGGRPNDEYEVIDMYLNMNFIFDVITNNKCHGTVVKSSWRLDGRAIDRLYTNFFFDICEY